jgi:hypothetical protein
LPLYIYFNPYLRKKIIWPTPIKMSGSVSESAAVSIMI